MVADTKVLFGSDFALLDVKRGRGALRRALIEDKRISCTLTADIDEVWGNDDGVSQEFTLAVRSLRVTIKPAKRGTK